MHAELMLSSTDRYEKGVSRLRQVKGSKLHNSLALQKELQAHVAFMLLLPFQEKKSALNARYVFQLWYVGVKRMDTN